MAEDVTVHLSDALAAHVRAEARVRSLASLDECVIALLQESLLRPPQIPTDPAELERELLKGLEGEAREIPHEEWERRAEDLLARHRRSKAG